MIITCTDKTLKRTTSEVRSLVQAAKKLPLKMEESLNSFKELKTKIQSIKTKKKEHISLTSIKNQCISNKNTLLGIQKSLTESQATLDKLVLEFDTDCQNILDSIATLSN